MAMLTITFCVGCGRGAGVPGDPAGHAGERQGRGAPPTRGDHGMSQIWGYFVTIFRCICNFWKTKIF